MASPRIRIAVVLARCGITHIHGSLIARLVKSENWAVVVLTHFDERSHSFEHGHLLSLLRGWKHVTIETGPVVPPAADVVLFRFGEDLTPVAHLLRQARVAALSVNDLGTSPRYAAAALWRTFRQAQRCHLVVAECRSLKWNPYRGWRRTVLFEPNVHPNFWFNPEAAARMDVPPPAADQPRGFRLTFVGDSTPESRTRALQQCREALVDGEFVNVFWLEYGANGRRTSLDWGAYLDVLDGSDFVLSPPGWGPWTHRLAEALVRHCIPIAPASECEALGLADGSTAIFVSGNNWADSVRRAMRMTPTEVAGSRRAIANFAKQVLSPDAASRRMLQALGLEPR